MRLDASGNLLVGTTDDQPPTNSDVSGIALRSDGKVAASRNNGIAADFNNNSEGNIVWFRKNGSVVATVSTRTGGGDAPYFGGYTNADTGIAFSSARMYPVTSSGVVANGTRDLGNTDARWKDLYLSGGILADGISTVSSIRENVTTDSSTSGVLNISLLGTSVRYLTANQTANRTLNFRGDVSTSLNSIMAVGESITTAVIATQGTTAYYFNTIQIDTSAVTPKWQGGSAPTGGNASGIDSYNFTIIKTADATFTVLASQTQFA